MLQQIERRAVVLGPRGGLLGISALRRRRADGLLRRIRLLQIASDRLQVCGRFEIIRIRCWIAISLRT